MKVPKTSSSESKSSFGLGNIIGLIFVLMGILLILNLMNFNLPMELENFEIILQYGAALGSILGGLSMLFKKTETAQTVKRK